MPAKKKKVAKKASKRKASPVPEGYGTVTATLNQTDASATIAFCKKAFGAKVRMQMPGPGGKLLHAEVVIGDSVVMVSDALQEPARVGSLFLYVPSVDKTMAKAVQAGARITQQVQNMFWGDRFGRLVDPQGNLWSVATHVEDVPAREMKKRQREFAQMAG